MEHQPLSEQGPAQGDASTARPQSRGEAGVTLQQQVYDFVKTKIMNRELKPGEHISDSRIARELDISRTPVRGALRLLAHEGFLVSQAGRGWKVYSLSLADIQEIFDVKLALEGAIVRWAADCDDELKRVALNDAMERMTQAARAGDSETWKQVDAKLHEVIFSMCSNERAANIIRNLNEQWWRVHIGMIAIEGRIERSSLEHEAFVAAILAGDGEEAERQMRSHLRNLRQELVKVLSGLVLPFAHDGV